MTTNDPFTQLIYQACQHIKSAKNICILTGAGISAESGIPTFRDKQTGLWENYRAEDLASIDAFNNNPKMVWSWYQWRRSLVQDKKPNPAHIALAKWQNSTACNRNMTDNHTKNSNTQNSNMANNDKIANSDKKLEQIITLVTQNVDDLHEQAGSNAVHLHGHLWKNKCSHCNAPYEQQVDYNNEQLLPCPDCGSYVRPDIVWFGEMLPEKEWMIATYAATNCEVFMSIGTSSLVYPAAGLVTLAKRNQAVVIEINPNPTQDGQSSIIDVQIPYSAGQALPAIVKQLLT